MTTTSVYRFRGTNRHGISQVGTTREPPAVFVARRWKAGDRWLTVTNDDGTEVGLIGVLDDTRVWWADDDGRE